MGSPTNTKQNTNIQHPMDRAERTVRNTATGKWMSRLARLGYATKGVVYLIIGSLAVQLAVGHGGSATDQRGALRVIYEQPFGKFLLAIVALGLLGFALWSFIQAIFDTEGKGQSAKGILERVGYAVVGVSSGTLAFGAYQLAAGTGSGGQGSTTNAQDWTALLLKQPFGVVLVALVGLTIIAVAFYIFSKAYTTKFRSHLNLATVDAQMRRGIILVGRCGYAALGVVFSIVGIFLIVAAAQHNPKQAKGLDSALQTLLHQPFGPLLLGIVALGLIAYGVYSLVEARYRRVGRG